MRHDPKTCPHCGCEVEERKRRSPNQHRLFFAAVKSAFDNWPINHSFRPSSEEHLRAYLLVQANYCNVIGQNLTDEADIFRVADFTERLMASIRSNGGFGFVEIVGRKSIMVRYPKSINWRELDQRGFQPIADAVFEIIQNEVGVSVDELIRGLDAA